jgi:acylphosphatase
MRPSYRFVVTGRVQGVGFRVWARNKALSLGLRGWIRNRADGAVEGLAGGAEAELQAFRGFLGKGPPAGRVDRLEWSASTDPVDEGFVVMRQ